MGKEQQKVKGIGVPRKFPVVGHPLYSLHKNTAKGCWNA
jgi:hypothetical protein